MAAPLTDGRICSGEDQYSQHLDLRRCRDHCRSSHSPPVRRRGVNRRLGMSLFQVLRRAQVLATWFQNWRSHGTFPVVDYQLALLASRPRSGSRCVSRLVVYKLTGMLIGQIAYPQTTASHYRTEEGGHVYFQGRVSTTTSIEARQQQHQPQDVTPCR